jgi:gas vesicle protein
MKPSDKFRIFYFIIGVGLGVIAGLLCAPRPGRETRDELRRGALDGLDYVSDEATKARASAERWLGKMKNNLFRGRDSGAGSTAEPSLQ